MRPQAISPSPGDPSGRSGLGNWHTPVPYLFVGLGALLVLIVVALIFLFCSSHKPSQRPQSPGGPVAALEDSGPKIVVVMPGDGRATYLAKPTELVLHA
ncbi:Protein GLUTAMINE DUMPER 2 [Acorus calamus]|uniref:Protein GLUTAMINE DUMPER 2 n=1 Tax=Acorus calamus TaxID=4465 RepID=A0AAV9D5D7_ACOCL|nr:Protein GLUTAMINE DUMPER 2 [Acorus calamus]